MVSAVVVSGAVVVTCAVVVLLSVGCDTAVVVVVVTITRCTAFSSFADPLQAPAAHSTAMQAATVPIDKPVLLFFVIMIPPFLW